MRFAIIAAAMLAGCASSPEYVAGKSDMTVCRFTLGGPHASAADAEARRRGLNCQAMYPAIQAQQASEAAATQDFLRAIQPQRRPPPTIAPPSTCRTVRIGDAWQTQCF